MILQVVFDLDDTLIRSDQIFPKFINFLGGSDNLGLFVGSLTGQSYHEIFDAIAGQESKQIAQEFMDRYLNWYDSVGWKLHRPFPGTLELLTSIQNYWGRKIIIVTNKRTVAAERIVKSIFPGLKTEVIGVNSDNHIGKGVHLNRLRGNFTRERLYNLIYVGDSLEDREHALESGFDFVGACWKVRPESFPEGTKCFSSVQSLSDWVFQQSHISL